MALSKQVKVRGYAIVLIFVVLLSSLLTIGTTFSSDSTAYQNQPYTTKRANVRSCARLNCSVVVVLQRGDWVTILEEVQGDSVSGSTKWYEITSNGKNGYVHSTLVSQGSQSTSQSTSQTTNQSNNSNLTSQPTSRPRNNTLVSTPQAPVSQPSSSAFSCNCSKSCTAILTCEEAYYQLNECGCGQRDSDDDGVPCESVCGG